MEYNKAAKEAFDSFKAKNGIARSEDMTPDQAKKFVAEIKASSDPRIRGLNVGIFMKEVGFICAGFRAGWIKEQGHGVR